MTTLGARLRAARERQNLRQVQVAKFLGISNKTVSGYENGVSEPDADTLARLAELYEVSTDFLITGHASTARESATSSGTSIGPAPDQNPLGIQLSDDQLEILRDVMSDPNLVLMFRDFANSTEDERRTMLDVWAAIRKRK